MSYPQLLLVANSLYGCIKVASFIINFDALYMAKLFFKPLVSTLVATALQKPALSYKHYIPNVI